MGIYVKGVVKLTRSTKKGFWGRGRMKCLGVQVRAGDAIVCREKELIGDDGERRANFVRKTKWKHLFLVTFSLALPKGESYLAPRKLFPCLYRI